MVRTVRDNSAAISFGSYCVLKILLPYILI